MEKIGILERLNDLNMLKSLIEHEGIACYVDDIIDLLPKEMYDSLCKCALNLINAEMICLFAKAYNVKLDIPQS